jgi:hypothetical protein
MSWKVHMARKRRKSNEESKLEAIQPVDQRVKSIRSAERSSAR